MDRVHAFVILAWGLLRSLLAPLFGARRGLPQFRESYRADRLFSVTAEERAAFATLGRCVACGLCNVGEGARMAESGGAYGGAMDLMLASSRNMPDFDAAARSFALVPETRLAELEALCPARVPMRRIARFVTTPRKGEG